MLILILVSSFYNFRQPPAEKIDPRCLAQEQVRAWVYFTDKAVTVEHYASALDAARSALSPASAARRQRRGGRLDYADIPVSPDYVAAIEECGGILIRSSKWLNAASFYLYRDDLAGIAGLPFVFRIVPVASYAPAEAGETAVQAEDTLVYGLAYRQLRMFNIDPLHERSIFGSNVTVGIMDTGLKRNHNALDGIRVVGEHDFYGGDQVYLGAVPVTEKYGVYSGLVPYRTASGRLYLFLEGDTTSSNVPVRDILYTFSDDDGAFWQPVRKLTHHFNNWAIEATVCGRDTLFVFYRDRNGINYLVYSCLNDSILVTPVLWPGYSHEPTAAQIGDTVYAFYQFHNKLFMKTGNVSGGFSDTTRVDSCNAVDALKNPVAVAGVDKLGVFYHTIFPDSLFFLRGSVPPDSFQRSYLYPGSSARAVAFGDTICLTWRDAGAAPRYRVGFARSNDFGAVFSAPQYLAEDLPAVNQIAINRKGSDITVAWETAGHIFYRTSYDGGFTFGGTDSLPNDFAYLPWLVPTATVIPLGYAVRGDSDTYDASIQPNHGTEMLGLIGGYSQSQYRGVAPGVNFLVAKTEIRDSIYEFPVEEDTWIAGLEWMESRGADIVNSSLGYTNWYQWPYDYDGKTSPASIAATEAYQRGMIIVTAAGNLSVHQLVVPGDAEGALTIGGIDTLFLRWRYSGWGPTYDGRLKPELMSLSAATVVVDPDSTSSYLLSTGTSGATAMASGMCALLLEAHPNWTVDSVRHALLTTASAASAPTDSMGYGWPDVFAAANHSPWATDDTVPANAFLTPYPNPFAPDQQERVYLPFKLKESGYATLKVFSISGRLLWTEERSGPLLPGQYTSRIASAPDRAFTWNGRDQEDQLVASGIYYCVLVMTSGGNDLVKVAVVR